MTETQERFLRTILTRVNLDDIVEMHLFPPIRRGTMETGVAVIATTLPPVPLTVIEGTEPVSPELNVDAAAEVPVRVDALASEVVSADTVVDTDSEAEIAPVVATHDELADDDSPYADEPVAIADEAEEPQPYAEPEMQLVTEDESEAEMTTVAEAPAPRMRILTAMYRHTVKGIDRGKWVVDVQEEADAPLAAVEAVLRGVRQRSTEPADPELVSPEMLAALLEPTRVAPAA